MNTVFDLLTTLRKNQLFKNSSLLMATTVMMSGLGFVFWSLNAKVYSSYEIGIATTFISLVTLITTLTPLGLSFAFIKFLPKEERKSEFINTALTFAGIVTLLVSCITLLLIDRFSPSLAFLQQGPINVLIIGFLLISTVSTLVDSIFISLRSAKFVLLNNSLNSSLKILFALLSAQFGGVAIILSIVCATFISTGISLYLLNKYLKVKLLPSWNFSVLNRVWGFSLTNYVSGLISTVPVTVIPILVTNQLGAAMTAYYYMPSMIISLLQTIPRSTASSLFVEGAHEENKILINLKRTLLINGLILIPAIALTITFGPLVLSMLGRNYSVEGNDYLRISAVVLLLNVPNFLLNTLFNLKKYLSINLFVSIVNCILMIGLTMYLLKYGIAGIALATGITQVIVLSLNLFFFINKRQDIFH